MESFDYEAGFEDLVSSVPEERRGEFRRDWDSSSVLMKTLKEVMDDEEAHDKIHDSLTKAFVLAYGRVMNPGIPINEEVMVGMECILALFLASQKLRSLPAMSQAERVAERAWRA